MEDRKEGDKKLKLWTTANVYHNIKIFAMKMCKLMSCIQISYKKNLRYRM